MANARFSPFPVRKQNIAALCLQALHLDRDVDFICQAEIETASVIAPIHDARSIDADQTCGMLKKIVFGEASGQQSLGYVMH